MRRFCYFVALLICALVWSPFGMGQTPAEPSDEDILDVAREIMISARYCALVTVDEKGQPQARAMDPFPPDGNITVRLGTNRRTRKVAQIRKNPRVALYYFEPKGGSYVTISGVARLIDDASEKRSWWKEDWAPFYKDSFRGEDYLLIEVVARRCEVVSAEHKIAADPSSWEPAVVVLP